MITTAATRDPRSDTFLTFNQFCFRIRDCGDIGVDKPNRVKRKVPVYLSHDSYDEFVPSFSFRFCLDNNQNAVMSNLSSASSNFSLPPQGIRMLDHLQEDTKMEQPSPNLKSHEIPVR